MAAARILHLKAPRGVPLMVHFGPGLTVRGHTRLDEAGAAEPS